MKKKSPLKPIVVVALAVILVVFLVRHFHINNFHTVVPGVLYTSGQPEGMDYTRLLYKYHLATVVNVRASSEHREQNWYNEEVTWIRENGVSYKELPLLRNSRNNEHFPDQKTQKAFLKIMADKTNLPVLVHGSSGEERVAMLVAVYLIKGADESVDSAAKIARKIKGSPLSKAEEQFIKSLAR